MDSGGSVGEAAVGATVIGDVVVAGDSPFLVLSDAVDGVLESGVAPASGNDAAGVLKAIERDRRRLYAAEIEALDQIDRRGLHRTDGHASAQVQLRHVAKLSGGQARAGARRGRGHRPVDVADLTMRAWMLALALAACAQGPSIARTRTTHQRRTSHRSTIR